MSDCYDTKDCPGDCEGCGVHDEQAQGMSDLGRYQVYESDPDALCDPADDVLVRLGEPEDRTWSRDLRPVVERLNDQWAGWQTLLNRAKKAEARAEELEKALRVARDLRADPDAGRTTLEVLGMIRDAAGRALGGGKEPDHG